MDPNTISISAELHNDVMTIASVVITGVVGLVAKWARDHFNTSNDAMKNAAIAAFASRLAPFLIAELAKVGQNVTDVNVHSPIVAAFGQSIVDGYPKFTADLGLTPQTAGNFVVGEAAKLLQLGGPPMVVSALPQLADPTADPTPTPEPPAQPLPNTDTRRMGLPRPVPIGIG